MVNTQVNANVLTMDSIHNSIKEFKETGGIVSASELESEVTINY